MKGLFHGGLAAKGLFGPKSREVQVLEKENYLIWIINKNQTEGVLGDK